MVLCAWQVSNHHFSLLCHTRTTPCISLWMQQHHREQLLEECAGSATRRRQNSWSAFSSDHQEELGIRHSEVTNDDTEPSWGLMDQCAASSHFDSWTKKNELLQRLGEVGLQFFELLPIGTHNQHVVCHPLCAIWREHASELQRAPSFWPNSQSATLPSGYPPRQHNECAVPWCLLPPPDCRHFHLIGQPAQKSCRLHHQLLPL